MYGYKTLSLSEKTLTLAHVSMTMGVFNFPRK